MSSTQRDVITLRRMQFHASVGVYPHERQFPQPIEIDLSVEIERQPAGQVVDYARLYDDVARVMADAQAGGHIEYIETIAERVAAAATATAGVHTAHVTVRKPHVALAGPLAAAELRITRSRG